MVTQIAELVGFDFVLLGFGVVHILPSGTVTPRAFHDALLAKKVGGLDCIRFVGGAEDDAITEIQHEHL